MSWIRWVCFFLRQRVNCELEELAFSLLVTSYYFRMLTVSFSSSKCVLYVDILLHMRSIASRTAISLLDLCVDTCICLFEELAELAELCYHPVVEEVHKKINPLTEIEIK